VEKDNKPFNIYYIQQLRAIEAILTSTDQYFYRKICRWFSETFHTPLLDVYKIPYPKLLQEYYESRLGELDYNDVYDLASTEYVPELADAYEEENTKFAESLVEEQEETLRLKAERDGKAKEGNKPQSLEKPSTTTPNTIDDTERPKELDLNFEDDGEEDEE